MGIERACNPVVNGMKGRTWPGVLALLREGLYLLSPSRHSRPPGTSDGENR